MDDGESDNRMKSMSASYARAHFQEVLRELETHDVLMVVGRTGVPSAVMVRPSTYFAHSVGDEPIESGWQERLSAAQNAFRSVWGEQPLPDIEELIETGRHE